MPVFQPGDSLVGHAPARPEWWDFTNENLLPSGMVDIIDKDELVHWPEPLQVQYVAWEMAVLRLEDLMRECQAMEMRSQSSTDDDPTFDLWCRCRFYRRHLLAPGGLQVRKRDSSREIIEFARAGPYGDTGYLTEVGYAVQIDTMPANNKLRLLHKRYLDILRDYDPKFITEDEEITPIEDVEQDIEEMQRILEAHEERDSDINAELMQVELEIEQFWSLDLSVASRQQADEHYNALEQKYRYYQKQHNDLERDFQLEIVRPRMQVSQDILKHLYQHPCHHGQHQTMHRPW